jgi:hypothetical protein
MNTFGFRSIVAVTALCFLSHGVRAQSYREKEAALTERIDLRVEDRVPEFDKARAIDQLYQLVFQSGLNSYFHKGSGLVRQILVEQIPLADRLTPEAAASVTSLRAHTLTYPAQYDASAIIAESLPHEAQTLRELQNKTQSLSSRISSLSIVSETDLIQRLPNANRTRLALLESFDTLISSNPSLLSALRSYTGFELVDGIQIYGHNELSLKQDSQGRRTARLVVGRAGAHRRDVFLGTLELKHVLEIGLLHGFGVRPYYFMNRQEYSEGLASLVQALNEPSVRNRLRRNGVASFEIDALFRRRGKLFENGRLVVGLTEEDTLQVIDLLFP